jgi:hypothetical protein
VTTGRAWVSGMCIVLRQDFGQDSSLEEATSTLQAEADRRR